MTDRPEIREYRTRNNILWNHGFKNHQEFLASEYWANLRRKHFKKLDNQRCSACGTTTNLNVHHRTYKHLLHADGEPRYLVTLCREHHQTVHEHQHTKHRTTRTSTKRVLKKIRKRLKKDRAKGQYANQRS